LLLSEEGTCNGFATEILDIALALAGFARPEDHGELPNRNAVLSQMRNGRLLLPTVNTRSPSMTICILSFAENFLRVDFLICLITSFGSAISSTPFRDQGISIS